VYELNRVRLVGIGPRGARYTDVTLDLSGVGPVIPSGTLFDAPTRRPSPYTLLMLENGGGKSVLLTLLFSVVLPGRKKTVAGAALEKFVLDSDTGHVALEWMHVRTGDRLITAKVYQRRTPTAGNTNPLSEAWYSFRPSPTLDLATLPIAVEGRRRRFDGYRDAVEQAARGASAASELAWLGNDQKLWREHLRNHGIEPDLFDIQRSMNIDEGDAANAFKFTSSKAFVDWILRTVTDPADASSVAETFEQWATTLAGWRTMLLERDFLEGAIAGLDPLAAAWDAHVDAEKDAATASTSAAELAAALAGRHSTESEQVKSLEAELGIARGNVVTAETATRTARNTLNEIQLQTLRLEHADAVAAQETSNEELLVVELELDGWDTVPLIQQVTAADAQARSLREQVTAADQSAAGYLRRRDEAAGRLLAKLDSEATASDQQAELLDERADGERLEADHADDERTDALEVASDGRARRDAAEKQVARTEEALTAAIRDALVPAGTRIGDVREVLRRATDHHLAQQSALASARSTAVDLIRRVGDHDTALAAANDVLTAANRAADQAQLAADTVDRAATRLGRLPAIADRAGECGTANTNAAHTDPAGGASDDIADEQTLTADELDGAADTLLSVLAADIDAHTGQLDTLRGEQREDTRVLQALGDGGLLPPRQEVDRAIEVLTHAGIAAHPGWRYLRDAAPEHLREDLIGAHPDLADGVVVIDPAHLPAARATLTTARLLPAAAIAVGSSATFLALSPPTLVGEVATTETPDGDGSDVRFVIEPSPAMYDESAAEVARTELLATLESRAHTLEDVGGQLAEVTDARAQLSGWRRDNPPGHLTALRATAGRLGTDADRRLAAVQELRAQRDELAAQRDTAVDQVETIGDAERAAADRVRRLERLAEQATEGGQAAAALPGIDSEIAAATAIADRAKSRRADHLTRGRLLSQQAEQHRGQARVHRAACDEVISTDATRASDVPVEPVPVLRAEAAAAHVTYLAAAADPDLRAKAEQAAQRAGDLRTNLAQRDQQHIREGRRLLGTPGGADPASWATAASNARARRQRLRERVDDLTKNVGRLDQAITSALPTEGGRRSWTLLPPEKTPTSAAHGQTLLREATEQQRTAQAAFETARATAERLEAGKDTAEASMRGFHEAMLPLRAVLGTMASPSQAPPYAGSIGEAQAASDTAVIRLNATRATATARKEELNDATNELTQYTHQNRFDAMTNPVRRSILGSAPAQLGAKASEWSALLQARLVSLVSDLENAQQHRRSIVDRLTALVTQALGTLRTASRLSKLPDDLGDWARRPFLRIGFGEPDVGTISVRVATVVDDIAAQFASRAATARGPKRDGMALLLEAVHAAVPKGFAVNVLKPDSVLRDERVSIEEMKEIFSGGQELTAAIVLYCTLAALRANERGQMRAKHSGVLFLDNPIGKASATYLLDVQQSVAKSLGVQLVYTTGLFDDRVLASFPLWIRMRNDADLRAGLKHLRVAEVVRHVLPDPYTDGELETSGTTGKASAPGTVTATRIHRRPTASSTEPAPTGEPVPAP
jgi:hypothetical protein